MQVLWVTGSPPRVGGGGDTIRQAHLLRAVAERHPTDLLVAGAYDDPLSRPVLRDVIELRVDVTRRPTGWRRRLRDLIHLVTGDLPMEAVVEQERRQALSRELRPRAHGYDVVMVEHSWLAPLLPRSRSGHWCITFHYLPSAFLEQAAAIAETARVRLLERVDARRARRLERWAVEHYDLTIAVSDEDARALGTDTVIPNGVDTGTFTPAPLPDRHGLVFVGTLGFRPNVEGIGWFCREVLPEVRRHVPDATLTIVGRDPVPEVRALAGGAVRIVEGPPSVVPHLHEARVALVPVRIGSGTRLKALEAMAAGRPVVGTSIGLAGLGIVDGEHALVRDDPAATAEAVAALLVDDDLAGHLAGRGRRLVEERFSWDAIGRRLVERLDELGAAP